MAIQFDSSIEVDGNIQVNGGNVGIGTTSLASKLQVNTGSDINAQIGLDSFGSFKLGDVSNNYSGRGIYYDGTAGSEDLDVLTNTFNIAGNFGEGIKVVSGGDVQLSSPIGVALTIDSTNSNVGIGTTSPDVKLEVESTASASGIRIKNTNNGFASIDIESNRVVGANLGGLRYRKTGEAASQAEINYVAGTRFDFLLGSGVSSPAQKLSILQGGNVGIGTTNPIATLDVTGSVLGAKIHSAQSTGLQVSGGGNLQDIARFQNVSGSTKVTIDTNGNVGIGETNPDTLLHITGNEPTIKLEDNVAGDYYNPKIEFFGFGEGGTLEYISNPGFSGMRLHYRNTGLNQDTYLELKNGQAAFTSANITGGVNVSMTGELQVFGADTSYFSNGKVAIGTTTASEKLYVVGNTSITNNLYVGQSNILKSCTYSAQYSLVVGQSNTLGGISNGIIGVSNTIACTNEPWLNFGGNFIAGLNNEIFGGYSHANAIFGQLNELGTASIHNSNTLIGGSEHEVTTSNSLLFGKQCRSLGGATYGLTGGFDSNNFAGFGSVAIGAGATASAGNNQYAFGAGVTTNTTPTNAYGSDQFVVGKYNEYTNASSVPHRFAVGNGANDASRDTPFCVIGGGTYTNGQVSINDADGFAYSSAPYSIFHVNGRATSSYSSVFTVTSDERLKKDILDYNKGLAEILQVQPKSYAFNGKGNTIENVESIGVLAQEIKEVFPETVGTVNKRLNPEDEQETELYTVDISPVTYALINAVKELNAKVEALEARIQTLEGN